MWNPRISGSGNAKLSTAFDVIHRFILLFACDMPEIGFVGTAFSWRFHRCATPYGNLNHMVVLCVPGAPSMQLGSGNWADQGSTHWVLKTLRRKKPYASQMLSYKIFSFLRTDPENRRNWRVCAGKMLQYSNMRFKKVVKYIFLRKLQAFEVRYSSTCYFHWR
jgi:hypothetical protein